ncbi:MAG: PorT family protein [Bacteroidales bacterium]|jgi:hypothetical protein|nr:PorT family protein [Bacteroidales bacterium]
MKKIILLTSFLLLTQLGSAQVNIGARMGLNAGLFELKGADMDKYKITPRYNVLINLDADVPFSLVFSFRTGIGLVQKWSEVDHITPIDTTSVFYKMSYLEMPLFLVARGETDFFGNFYFGVGPTLSLGVGGQVNIFKNLGGSPYEDSPKINWNGKPAPPEHHGFNHFKRFDFGIGAILAYQLPRSGITFTASYNKGLRDISPNPDVTFRTSYVGLSIGFFMNK